MDNSENSFIPKTIVATERAENIIPEVDLTGKDLLAIHAAMTESIKAGHVLHGSPNPSLSILMPRLAIDVLKRNKTAVFATDQPNIPIARAIGGDNLSSWLNSFLFKIQDKSKPLPTAAYVYELSKKTFVADTYDESEYASEEAVVPLRRFKFDDFSIAGSFRTDEEWNNLVSKEGVYNPQYMRDTDMTNILLSMRNLLKLSGDISYVRSDEPQEKYFLRLETIAKAAKPFIDQIERLDNPTNRKLIGEILPLYYNNTFDIFNVENPTIYMAYGGMDKIFKKLENYIKG